MMDGYLDNDNKKAKKNGRITYSSYGRPLGDGGDPTVVQELAEGTRLGTPVAVATGSVTQWENGKMKFDWTDSNNDPSWVESYAIYIWSSELGDGRYFYRDNDGTQGPYSIQSDVILTPGSYSVEIEPEGYGEGESSPKIVMTGSPITIVAP